MYEKTKIFKSPENYLARRGLSFAWLLTFTKSRDEIDFVNINVKSHAREEPLLAGYQRATSGQQGSLGTARPKPADNNIVYRIAISQKMHLFLI